MEESLPALFEFKRSMAAQLKNVPYVAESEPAVCAWYPSAHLVIVWNLSDQSRQFTVLHGPDRHVVETGPLAAEVVRLG